MGKRRASKKRRHVKNAGARRANGCSRGAGRRPAATTFADAERAASAAACNTSRDNRIFFALLMGPVLLIAVAVAATQSMAVLVQISRTVIEPMGEVGFLIERPVLAVANFTGSPAHAATTFGSPVKETGPGALLGARKSVAQFSDAVMIDDVLKPVTSARAVGGVVASLPIKESAPFDATTHDLLPRLALSDIPLEMALLVRPRPSGPSVSAGEAVGSRDFRPGLVLPSQKPSKYRTCHLAQLDAARQSFGRTLAADGVDFGVQLARAARQQTQSFTIYNNAYIPISYPSGDIPSLYGVCSDVIIRAYRVLGIDLQTLVHDAGVGLGDSNIDHRRVKTLQRFFSRFGERLPASTFVEDYRAGDVVIYRRSPSQGSRAHIAIVSDIIAASGRPMIVHNRGWGPQLEDALFADHITGHYRFGRITLETKRIGRNAISIGRKRETHVDKTIEQISLE